MSAIKLRRKSFEKEVAYMWLKRVCETGRYRILSLSSAKAGAEISNIRGIGICADFVSTPCEEVANGSR